MRSLSTTLLLLFLLCSCEKNDTEATPSIDVTGTWQLSAKMPFPDTTWSAIASTDSASYVFGNNGQFSFDAKAHHVTGVYKVLADGNGVKLIITGTDSLSQYLQVQKSGDSAIRVDDWLKGISQKGYASKMFKKIN
ncbi:hypothetical protein GO495_30360 [Chitinophaga oryziterrae]|uniref:Lipocalin-like domain-containing protein n=1 Tax=Chitinophaga oryziterrae TaxID=1031224 RepID=A0A6N8JL91_9BACT|nr:hypothetical protein [Chitinophaga oryziterrae]MVT44932.1 hypothetical protein [Chitinophaga oryziterrae]